MKIVNFGVKKSIIFVIIILILLGAYYFLNLKLTNTLNSKIDFIKVDKSERKLYAYSANKLIKVYKIALGKNPKGAKHFQGDNKTPEGEYHINARNPNSIAYKNLGISYPNNNDIANAKRFGKPTGGDIKIHGMMNGLGFIGRFHTCFDWTNGCIAVTNSEMEELFKHIKIGTTIEIVP